GGNVMNTVAMRLLPLDRTGLIKLPPARERNSTGIDPSCTPGREEECSFNRQDWAALLQLTATAPTPSAPPMPPPPLSAPPDSPQPVPSQVPSPVR
ncbi:TPA: DUF2272 domain-containing protein, partial [Stenotrophomonas maltophilia]|nr:DUF2272 domain-containing protein [Stenotrophomonas maltophilia]